MSVLYCKFLKFFVDDLCKVFDIINLNANVILIYYVHSSLRACIIDRNMKQGTYASRLSRGRGDYFYTIL